MSVVIPEHISILGVYTSHMVLLLSCVVYFYNDKILSYLLFLLYLCSVLNWMKQYFFSWIKLFDIIIAIIILNYITFYSKQYYKPFYKQLWNYSLLFSNDKFYY